MKNAIKRISLILLISGSFSLSAQNNTAEAVEYMNKVTEKAFELEDETWKYLKAVTKGKKASKVEDKREELVRAIKTAKLSIGRRKDFNGDATLKDAIVNYLDLRYTVLKEDYDKILDMEEIAEQSYDAMEAYLLAQEKASEKLDSAFMIMSVAQIAFADKYGIQLSDDRSRRREKIKKASETLEYYNDVYLIFFKSYKQEAYVLEAIERNDVSSIEQNNSGLKSISNESLKDLRSIKPFKGDGSLIFATRKALNFFESEANNEFSSISDFYLKKDEFEKINERMEAKSKKEITQEDVDKYNKAVDEYNKASENFNNSMQNLYKEREKVLNDWSKEAERFINAHSS